MRAGYDQARARFRDQILGRFVEPARVVFLRLDRRLQGNQDRREVRILGRDRNLARQGMGDRGDLARRVAQTMIGHRAGQREVILDDVEPIHRILGLTHAPPRSEAANRSEIAFAAIQEIAVERENDVGLVELRNQSRVLAKAHLGREMLRLAQERIVDAPAHSRKLFLKLAPQPFTRRRMRFFDEKGKAGPAVCRYLRPQPGDIFFKRRAIGQACFSARIAANAKDRKDRAVTPARRRPSPLTVGLIGLPSILIGRPSTVETTSGMAP